MKKIIVTTTIQRPTEAIEKFDSLKDWDLIVVGDLKTPKNYKLKRGIYFSPKQQQKYCKKLSEFIGWNTHARRNFGHLLAKDMDADIIASVDDDNIPLNNWGKNIFVGKEIDTNYYKTDTDAFDPVGATNYPYLWHRGFPIQLVSKRTYKKEIKRIKIDIQADFWNGDPDIDAVCRMIHNPCCEFGNDCFPIASNKPSPFNSQNIFLGKNVLPYYFFLPHITPFGRMGDIWISYHLQSLGFKVVYGKPSVYQQRNAHDLTVDMKDEFIGYEKNLGIVTSINNGIYKKESFWTKAACKAFQSYRDCFK